MSKIDRIIDELQRIHDGDPWHGPSLHEVLKDVSAEQAAAHVLPDAHSIWELVRHITVWENVVWRRFAGEAVEEPEEGDFPAVEDTSAAAWTQALAKLDGEHARLIEVVSGFADTALRARVPTRDYSVGFQLASAVRHHVYHTGQIALLKKS